MNKTEKNATSFVYLQDRKINEVPAWRESERPGRHIHVTPLNNLNKFCQLYEKERENNQNVTIVFLNVTWACFEIFLLFSEASGIENKSNIQNSKNSGNSCNNTFSFHNVFSMTIGARNALQQHTEQIHT